MKEHLQNIEFRKATPEDIDLLVKTRIEVLRAANGLTGTTDMSEVEKHSREYYTLVRKLGKYILIFLSRTSLKQKRLSLRLLSECICLWRRITFEKAYNGTAGCCIVYRDTHV